MNRIIVIIFALIFSANLNAQKFFGKDGKISFISEAPMEDIKAINNKVGAVYDRATGELVFQLDIQDFIFPKPLMQEHFNENYLESDIYPKSTFIGEVVSQDSDKAIVEGRLKIHGKTNNIRVNGILQQESNIINIAADFIVKLEDYNIEIPRIVMYKIAEEIKVTGFINRRAMTGLYFYSNMVISTIDRNAADNQELKINDKVIAVNDIQVLSLNDIHNVLKRNDVRPGDTIKFKILRDGEIKIVNLVTR